MSHPIPPPPRPSTEKEILLTLSPEHVSSLRPYLPPPRSSYLPEDISVPGPSSYPLLTTTTSTSSSHLPWLTLTYATSLDSRIALAPGTRTTLSGPETKAMTHFLRAEHDAILIGVGTAMADDPGLNCRFDVASLEGVASTFDEVEDGRGERRKEQETSEGTSSPDIGIDKRSLSRQPRPLILDPSARWQPSICLRLFDNVLTRQGRPPFWLLSPTSFASLQASNDERITYLGSVGGKILPIASYDTRTSITSSSSSSSSTSPSDLPSRPTSSEKKTEKRLSWRPLLHALSTDLGIRSVMIEGGGRVIDDLLREANQALIRSLIVTLAPVYLGRAGVEVAPERREDEDGDGDGERRGKELRLREVKWLGMGSDVVMLASIPERTNG